MAKAQSLSLLLLLLLAVATTITRADISIILTNISNSSMIYENFSTLVLFDRGFSNVPSEGMKGFLHQPDPKDGCSYVSPIPNLKQGSSANYSDNWFAIIEDYPSCVESMLIHIKNAGYRLIIASSSSGKENGTLSKKTRNSGFPIIIVSANYTDYLIENALSNFTSPQIMADISANADLLMVVVVLPFTVVMFLVCFLCCSLCCYCRAQRARHYREITGVQQRQRNFDRLQDHDRIARRELIDSILRQLQQLQLDGEVQRPLGVEQTKKLPIKKYHRVSSIETCAICVDDFKEGDTQRVLPCHHSFHIKCVDEWLMNHSDLCPLCKNQVLQDKGEELPCRGRRGGSGNTARDVLMSFTEDEETDEYPLVRAARTGGQGGVGERYGSV